ncbi:conserved hypothetical protein [Neospora caninum Liverpool]|uniref:Uncharacterized protein n=1 Tax=Neospora caninum (strain Liverpool) TaxID=572307 RepID=F0V941_NEOCL|nr:conserved hypothetical protein [Neospora caninum Liverpool]CBZ50266.1 conserved hypothetical protein [Neospora caninum Liverpool]|eukprot:XP_003880300.1 conserved hypothetical protein [Neospora caninum Liverpool]
MLQAVSDFFFSDANYGDSDSEGFLSPRKKPSTVPPVPELHTDTVITRASLGNEFSSAPNADPVGPIDDHVPMAASSSNLLLTYQGLSEGVSQPSPDGYTDLSIGDAVHEALSAEALGVSPHDTAADMLDRREPELLVRRGRPQAKAELAKWGRGSTENLRSRLPSATAQQKALNVSQPSTYQQQTPRVPLQPVPPAPRGHGESDGRIPETDNESSVLRSNANATGWEEKAKGIMSLMEQATKMFVGSRTGSSQSLPGREEIAASAANTSALSTASPALSQGLASLLVGGMPQAVSPSTSGPSIAFQTTNHSPAEFAAYAALLPSHADRPSLTLDTLRQSEGLGKTFAQGVDVGSAVVDVLTSTRELQQALSALNIPGLPVNSGAPPRQAFQNRDDLSLMSLINAAKAVHQFAHWSTTVDKVINTSKDFTQSVPATLRSLFPSNRVGAEEFEDLVNDKSNHANSTTAHEFATTEVDASEERLYENMHTAPSHPDDVTSSHSTPTATSASIPKPRPHMEEAAQYGGVRLADAKDSGAKPHTDKRSRILSASVSASDVGSLIKKESRDAATRTLLQASAGVGGPMRLFTKSASLMDEMAQALKKEETVPQASGATVAGGEYVVGLARDLHKMASFLFNVLDVTVSVADESMNALQLGNLVNTYKTLAEEGALAPLGVKATGAPPEHMGKPTVSCVSKGMTCCVPAAAAPEWKTKPLYLQNEQRRECKANLVTRTSMLCATTPYKNSKCGIIHTKANGYNKYATVLPVAGFTATAMCECEVSKQKSADGLYSFNGVASWTAPGKTVTRDVIKEAKDGWQFVKTLSKSGNQMLTVLENTLEPQRSPITGMADVMTKLVAWTANVTIRVRVIRMISQIANAYREAETQV